MAGLNGRERFPALTLIPSGVTAAASGSARAVLGAARAARLTERIRSVEVSRPTRQELIAAVAVGIGIALALADIILR